jgi:hypothetical protein
MTKLDTMRLRLRVAYLVISGRWEAEDITAMTKAKDEALRQALKALETIGQRPRGGSRYARATHAFLTTQLLDVGFKL